MRDGCDVAVGTPGRIVDMVESGKLDASNVRFFVLDEADRLLDSGNRGAILKLFDRMPKSGDGFVRLQVLLFSATLHSGDIEDLAARLCERPAWVDLRGKDSVPETVHHACVVVNPDERSTFDRCTFEDASGATLPPVPTDNAHAHDDVNEGADVDSMDQTKAKTKAKPKPKPKARGVPVGQAAQAAGAQAIDRRASNGPGAHLLSHQLRLRQRRVVSERVRGRARVPGQVGEGSGKSVQLRRVGRRSIDGRAAPKPRGVQGGRRSVSHLHRRRRAGFGHQGPALRHQRDAAGSERAWAITSTA